ncbi:hypothetical protein GIB67_014472 [Kingdonia uniflora]|uniref:RNA polymerase II C-terminal domain phosphatase-like n=1 Tax=Kingdonia uniflora TaxID=39325 RepID=A0A7J7LZ77_9MAGN|nr:hypothetical protein GIB67_014472 [Kingdonia uniflora]
MSSSSSDDFADLESELLAISSDESPDDEEVEVEEEELEVEDFENKRIKRQKVEVLEEIEEAQGSTSLGALRQESGASINDDICPHPASVGGMCVVCGEKEVDGSAVPFGYIHKALKIGSQELARMRRADLKSLLQKKKLYLVLDLDHTLLNSTRFLDISPDEGFLMNQTDSLEDIQKGSLFKLDSMHMLTKLRPFVRTFLKEASDMFEMYIYTMGEQSYALEMARLLDPGEVYFNSKVISQSDCTQRHQKGLDVVMGADNAVVILDDTEFVWSKHKENLILMERYHFFASSGRQFGLNFKSLSESSRDEVESDGTLSAILKVLKRVHQSFFNSDNEANLMSRDVRQVLKSVRKEVLKDCKLIFSHIWKREELPENQKLWLMAEQLGATCTTERNQSVTHVVSLEAGTDKAHWARKRGKFLVHPRWIEAANYFWKRQPEEAFELEPPKKP